VNAALSSWNEAEPKGAFDAMLACCGARRWAEAMVALRPIGSVLELSAAADHIWSTMEEADWMQAFDCHPRIGERTAPHASQKVMHSMSSDSALLILCAPRARARKRCWQS